MRDVWPLSCGGGRGGTKLSVRRGPSGTFGAGREDRSSRGSLPPASHPLDDYRWATEFYDISHDDVTEDLALFLKLARRCPGPILDGMCGTGRVAIPLARAGHSVVAIDWSSGMLREFRRKLRREPPSVRRRIRIAQTDLRELRTKDRFDLALLPFNSLPELLTLEEQAAVLQRISAHLRPGGRLVVHIDHPDRVEKEATRAILHNRTRMLPGGRVITISEAQEFDPRTRLLVMHLFYDVSRQGGTPKRTTTVWRMRATTLPELRGLLRRAGLRLERLYGDYPADPFRPTSPYIIAIARRGTAGRDER